MASTAAVRPQDLSLLLETNPICPGCHLRRAVREFATEVPAETYLYCHGCRVKGKTRKKVLKCQER